MSQPAADPAVPSGALIHRLTVQQYRAMALAGILTSDDQVELLEGWLVEKMTKNPPHRIATRRARLALEGVVPPGWYVDTQEPIVTADSEPEPDAAVIRGRTEDYADSHPAAEHVGLVVEVADATLLRDRHLKARVYARARIPRYVIVNRFDRCVEAYSEPSRGTEPPRYERVETLRAGQTMAVILDGTEVGRIRIDDLLP